MSDALLLQVALSVIALLAGIGLGWYLRSRRTQAEKAAINSGWQEQIEAQRVESSRLVEQNKSLMEQNSQFQASNKDAKMRARELSDALKEAFARRDDLQRQIKDIRGNLEIAMTQRERLQADIEDRSDSDASLGAALKEKDEKIFKLSRELDSWHERLPPLIERYRTRNAEAEALESELEVARERIRALESMVGSEQTRVEPVDPDALADSGMEASNEPIGVADTSTADLLDEELLAAAPTEGTESNGSLRDDLQSIKGVGPAIEKTLNEMGIFRFNQIAEMSEYDINRVAHRLKGFRTRIYREDWIGQARELHAEKIGT